MDIAKPEFDKDSVFYFYSTLSPWDIQQSEHSACLQMINRIGFRTSHHGIPFLKCSLVNLLQYDKQSLKELNGKSFDPVVFSIRVSGSITTIKFLFFELWRKLQHS